MGRACRVKERSDWHRICKISVLAVKITWHRLTHLSVYRVNPHWQRRFRLRFHVQITESRGLIIPWSALNLLRCASSTLFTYKVRGVEP